MIVLAEGAQELTLLSIDRVPLTHGGRVGFQVENVLAAVARLEPGIDAGSDAAGWNRSAPISIMYLAGSTCWKSTRGSSGRLCHNPSHCWPCWMR